MEVNDTEVQTLNEFNDTPLDTEKILVKAGRMVDMRDDPGRSNGRPWTVGGAAHVAMWVATPDLRGS